MILGRLGATTDPTRRSKSKRGYTPNLIGVAAPSYLLRPYHWLVVLPMSSFGLSKDHIAAIGELVVNMTRIESIIVDLLSIFMETSILNAIVAFYPVSFSS